MMPPTLTMSMSMSMDEGAEGEGEGEGDTAPSGGDGAEGQHGAAPDDRENGDDAGAEADEEEAAAGRAEIRHKRGRKPRGRPPDKDTRDEFDILPSENTLMKSERARCKHCAWERAYNLPRLRRHLGACLGFRQLVGAERVAELCARWHVVFAGATSDSDSSPRAAKRTRLRALEQNTEPRDTVGTQESQAPASRDALEATTRVLLRARVVTVIRAVDKTAALERACDLVENCGCRAIEITRDSDDWLYVLRGIVQRVGDKAAVGVGTILDAEEIEVAAEAGARFALSPVNPPGFVEACLRHGVVPFPGCFSPQEVFDAVSAGATFVKIFPAQSFGTAALRALRSISFFQGVRFLATGGIDEAAAHEWFDAGCAVVGMGALICGRDLGAKDPARAADLRQAYLADGGGRSKARVILARLGRPTEDAPGLD